MCICNIDPGPVILSKINYFLKFIVVSTYIRKEKKISKQQPNLTPQESRKEKQNKSKISRKKEIKRKKKISIEIEYRKLMFLKDQQN